MTIDLYFSQFYGVTADVLEEYGALDISLASDLPLFIDPFLLFNSERGDYQKLHQDILRYLRFLRDEATPHLDPGLLDAWFRFKEVKQNWLGFTAFGNDGAGLGRDFASALHSALGEIFSDFGHEPITTGSHLEKLCLIRPGVGRDNISDFTTNLIKAYLCDYTQAFARERISADRCATFPVPRARFNYDTKTWMTEQFYLPRLHDDFVLLTPLDMLTRDETWINYGDMLGKFIYLPEAVPDHQLRAQINHYFAQALGDDPDAKQQRAARARTIRRYPELIDWYIKGQEDSGNQAETLSAGKVSATRQELVEGVQTAIAALTTAGFYEHAWTTLEECLERVEFFRHYIEHQDGYLLFNPGDRRGSPEKFVQLAFGLVWGGTELDVSREVNNGRGPVDFKASFGAGDKALIEFKLARNTALKRNLEKQVAIYQAANKTPGAVKVILFYSEKEEARARGIVEDLGLQHDDWIVLIDARHDNKPSASNA